jgi:hypothetical protein
MPEISRRGLEELNREFEPLLGLKIDWLSVPEKALAGFEPSQRTSLDVKKEEVARSLKG